MGSKLKRALSPASKDNDSPNKPKRIHLTSDEPIVIEDDPEDQDDDLQAILAQIKQQEESEKLARELQQEWGSASSPSSAIVVEDGDEAVARRLAKEWEDADNNNEPTSGSNVAMDIEEIVSTRKQTQKGFPHKSAEGERTPSEKLAHYRATFVAERTCTKCSATVSSPRGYVMLSGSETISPTLGFLLHAPCSSCQTNHCRGCFRPISCPAKCKGKAKSSKCEAESCCAEGRAIAVFEALGGFDRHYIGERAISQTRAQSLANDNNSKAGAGSVGPGGTGYGTGSSYGSGYGYQIHGSGRGKRGSGADLESFRETKRSKELKDHWEELVIRALKMLTYLLPSPYSDSAAVYDMLPHPSIGPLLSSSKLPELLGDLLRNDSVTDWLARSEVYYAMMALLKRMADCELTVQVLLESRFVTAGDLGIEPWMWEEGEIEWKKEKGGKLERATPLYEYFRKLSKQSEAFTAGAAQLMESEEDPDETIRATALCGDIIATRDDLDRAISVLGINSNLEELGQVSRRSKSKGKAKDASVELEKAYSQACEGLAFRHVSLATTNSAGKGKAKDSGLMYHNFKYSSELSKTQNATRNPKDRLHLVKELAVLATSLPPGIWMRVDEVRNDTIKIMIAGPEGTPYADGLFEFDCFMPLAYPTQPPQMHLRTTGGGSVRFNPNLYNDGKVCLSLLGTWPGRPEEQWSPYKSTLLQVLVSIQSMIFVSHPYFNEPGYGQVNPNSQASISYNRNIAHQTTRWAIVDWLRDEHRNGIWAEIIASHFSIRKEKIRKQILDWAAKNPHMRSYSSRSASNAFGGFLSLPGMAIPAAPAPSQGMDLVKEFDQGMSRVQAWNFDAE